MSDTSTSIAGKAAIAAGAIGSAAIAAALLYVNRHRSGVAPATPPRTGKAPHFPGRDAAASGPASGHVNAAERSPATTVRTPPETD